MYTDAFHDKKNELIRVLERKGGKRIIKDYKPDYHFFVDAPNGEYKSIFGNPVKKVTPTSLDERNKLSRIIQGQKYEADANLVFRCLEQNYQGDATPSPNVAFFDIETDFDLVKGYSSPADAFNPITSIAVYLQWINQMVCLAVPPPTLTWEQAQEIAKDVPDVILYKTEKEMLDTFIDVIDDADIISGWNCISKEELVATSNGLVRLKNVLPDTILADGKTKVVRYFDSGRKEAWTAIPSLGPYLTITDEHVVPVYITDKDRELNINCLPEPKELRIGDIRELIKEHSVYISKPKHNSKKTKNATYRDLFPSITKFDYLDIEISDSVCYLLGYISNTFSNTSPKKRTRPGIYNSDLAKELYAGLEDLGQHVNLEDLTEFKVSLKGYTVVPLDFSYHSLLDQIRDALFYDSRITGTEANTELLSKLSFRQFQHFYAAIIDFNGSVRPVNGKIAIVRNYMIRNSHAYSVLLDWFGVLCEKTTSGVIIPNYDVNREFVETLPLRNEAKIATLETMINEIPISTANFLNSDMAIVQISRFNYVGTTEVADIETESHYFVCNGTKVHNSQAFDTPYIVNRISRKLGKESLKRLSPLGEMPVPREVENAGRKWTAYEFPGKVHLDYMDLYKKYNYEEKSSYALNSIAEAELGENKVEYEGTLDQLYKQDFKKFLEYNIKDTYLLHRLDTKLKYIFIANRMAHDTCVPLPTVLATVAPTDNLLTMIAHNMKKVVPNRGSHAESRAAGGWVAKPKKGVHRFVGSTDLNSLYPSVIRAFNMSPETIIGQVDISGTWKAIDDHCAAAKRNTFAGWWNDRFSPLEMEHFFNNDNYHRLKVHFEDGDTVEVTGAELRKLIFDSGQPWCISANGTIFRTDFDGLIPTMLTEKYAYRKSQQKIEKSFDRLCAGADTSFNNFEHNEDCNKTQDEIYSFNFDFINKDTLSEEFLKEWGLVVRSGKVWPRDDVKELYQNAVDYWNKLQTVSKLLLNGTYGAILNPGCRFFDQRIGQSTTLSGRNITRHMTAKTNEMLCGVYDHYGKCVVYGDSVTPDTVIKTAKGDMPVEELFNQGDIEVVNGKEYSLNHDTKVLSFDPSVEEPYFGAITHVYRHKTSKQMYEVESASGKKVKVTQDHSLMTYNNGELKMKKPEDLNNSDILVTLNYE